MHLGKKHPGYKSPAVRVVAHPGDEALAEVSLAEAEAEVRHLLLLTLQAEDLAHRVHVQVQEVLGQSEVSILSATNHSSPGRNTHPLDQSETSIAANCPPTPAHLLQPVDAGGGAVVELRRRGHDAVLEQLRVAGTEK